MVFGDNVKRYKFPSKLNSKKLAGIKLYASLDIGKFVLYFNNVKKYDGMLVVCESDSVINQTIIGNAAIKNVTSSSNCE